MSPREDVAAMLRAGATYAEIRNRLHVSDTLIHRTRRALNIPLPPERTRRSKAVLADLDDQAVSMLRAGATYTEIHRTLRLAFNRISRLRKQHGIPVPRHKRENPRRLTIDEAFTKHTQATAEGGHLLWTGPRSGRSFDLIASGRTHNARAEAFRRHHGRDPEGQTRRTCKLSDCIAGAHLTDRRIRQAHGPAS
ncbi:hypothetical protein [Streptomyces stelliscabiei]|uniref:hypothetical protein n=1 Tax=Streptomyces stelliscabiei TaxID=146820 RepID=UPI0029B65C4F|nr:hypothetical protein [Streptomyces stelliscabiei]MDX2667416.1 hypothetical protein [Streptomyces stelliscabiei]MDX2785955.1 hypothetical protein [Streptomyces stelliscabiei]